MAFIELSIWWRGGGVHLKNGVPPTRVVEEILMAFDPLNNHNNFHETSKVSTKLYKPKDSPKTIHICFIWLLRNTKKNKWYHKQPPLVYHSLQKGYTKKINMASNWTRMGKINEQIQQQLKQLRIYVNV